MGLIGCAGDGPHTLGVTDSITSLHSIMIMSECCFLLSACLDHCSHLLKKNPLTLTHTFDINYANTGINKEAVPRSRKTSMEIRNEAAAAGATEGNIVQYILNYVHMY